MLRNEELPWLISLALHVAVVALVVALVAANSAAPPPPVRMHLVTAGAGKPASKTTSATWKVPGREAPRRLVESAVPAWRNNSSHVAGDSRSVPVPVLLDELLGGSVAPAETVVKNQSGVGWSADGEGYAPPPLPPPGLAPPQGARWSLLLFVPGGGGFASHVEGLDSGHPELDRWLEQYLRTVAFPPSLDGADYQTKWLLRLETGRPQ